MFFGNIIVDHQVALVTFLVFVMHVVKSNPMASATDLPKNTPVMYTAIVNVTYRDPKTGEQKYEYNDGRFGSENRIGPSWGWLQLARSTNNRTDGCDPMVNQVEGWWVALIERGRCRFHQKIENAAVFNNASAVIIYDNEHDAKVLNMQHSVEDVVAIFLRRNDGLRLVKLMENNTRVFITISPGSTYFPSPDAPSRTSVIFLFISFIVLAIVSLLWLIFYYVQRFRVHSSLSAERARKNKIAKQLNRAAKLVVSKMEQKVLKADDPELSSVELQICAVCVEEYEVNDKIRILPCRHSFHKKCVDQWLQEKRRCPICQLDILKTAGIQIPEEYQNLNNESMQADPTNNNNTNVSSPGSSSSNRSPVADYAGDNNFFACDRSDNAVVVSVVPGCSTHLYLTGVAYINESVKTTGDDRVPDLQSDTTYHSNESLTTFEPVDDDRQKDVDLVRPEFKSRLSSDTLSLPSRMTSSSTTSSSSSSTFDIQDKAFRNIQQEAVVQQRQLRYNENNNNSSMTSVNSRLTAVASRRHVNDEDDEEENDSGDDDSNDDDDYDDDYDYDDDSISPSRYYDCHGESINKQQMN